MFAPFSLRRRATWAVAFFVLDKLTLPLLGSPTALLTSKKLVRGPRHIHTRADPFLYEHGDELYLFFEEQALDEPGSLAACRVTADGLEPLGTTLAEDFHLSYPQVFGHDGHVYLMPESQAAGALLLYRFDHFPYHPTLIRRVMEGKYADPTLLRADGLWYLFATTGRGLELFYTEDLINGEFKIHRASPITADARYSRCGGALFDYHGELVRPAQDGSTRYGGNINLMAIDMLTPSHYSERLLMPNALACHQPWNAMGGHHISVVPFKGQLCVAIDGQSNDYFVHKIIARAWMMLTNYRPGALKKNL